MSTDDSRIVHVDVEPGDPHNDQMAARARHDLRRHVASARNTLAQGDSAEAIAVIATVLADEAETFPRDRLAAMLAAALVELASGELPPYVDQQHAPSWNDPREVIRRADDLHQCRLLAWGDSASVRCDCGQWSIGTPINVRDANSAHQRHRADAIYRALRDGGLLLLTAAEGRR